VPCIRSSSTKNRVRQRNARIPREVLLSERDLGFKRARAGRAHPRHETVYNQARGRHGRMIASTTGDVIAGVLALAAPCAATPAWSEQDQGPETGWMSNLGGVIGRCTSVISELGKRCRRRSGTDSLVPAFGRGVEFPLDHDRRDPVGGQAGEIGSDRLCRRHLHDAQDVRLRRDIRYLAGKGHRVGGAKLTGVSLLRDNDEHGHDRRGREHVLHGRRRGSTTGKCPFRRERADHALNKEELDVLVIELGDGILGNTRPRDPLHDELMNAPRRTSCAPTIRCPHGVRSNCSNTASSAKST